MTSDTVVDVDRLTKIFKDFWGRPKKVAVSNLSLSLKKGEVLGLIGPNGAGKTTTLKVLLGLLKPSQGQVTLFGQNPRYLSVKSRLGFLPEESYLYRFLTPEETLLFFGRLFKIPPQELRKRITELLDKVGLTEAAHRPVREFSKGMARRLGLAQAMINDPELLILDEPTSGLDPVGTHEVKDLILEQKKQGKSVLVCSHLLADLEGVCDRIAMLHEGRLCLLDTVSHLLEEQNRVTFTFDQTDQKIVDQWCQWLQTQGAQNFQISHPRKSLEQLFIETLAKRPTSISS